MTPQSPAPVAGEEDAPPASEQPVEAIGAGREEEIPERAEGRLAERPWRVGDPLPAVGSVVLVSGVHGDIESDQHRGYLRRTVIGYGKDNAFICLQTEGCWPTVERTTNCWFAALSPASPARTPMGEGRDTAWRDVKDAPQDGTNILLKHRVHGVIEGWFSKGEWTDDTPISPREYTGDMWILGDDLSQDEVEFGPDGEILAGSVEGWLPLSTLAAPTPMGGEVEALREALECVEDYDHTGRLAGVLRQAIDGAVRIDHLTPDQQSDIRAHIIGLSDPEEDTYQAPEHGWTCFHCGATFKTTRGARMHFGHNVTGRPKCHDPERLVEIYDGAEAAVAAASPARADFEVRVARRDEARNAIIAALAAPTPMGGEVEALREALRLTRERVRDWPLDDHETCVCGSPVEGHSIGSGHSPVSQADHAISMIVEGINEALSASSPSPAQGGSRYTTLADLHTIKGWLHGLSTHPDLEDVVADGGVTAGMVYQQEAREFAGRIGRILAAPPSVQPVEGK